MPSSSSVLVVDPDVSRRRELSRGLSGYGYEVIPAVDEAEGRRFAASLGPGIVVAPVSMAAGGAPFLDRLGLATLNDAGELFVVRQFPAHGDRLLAQTLEPSRIDEPRPQHLRPAGRVALGEGRKLRLDLHRG